jgi:hypothetical protein
MSSLILECARSVMREQAAGRRVDPSRLAWACLVLAQQGAKEVA